MYYYPHLRIIIIMIIISEIQLFFLLPNQSSGSKFFMNAMISMKTWWKQQQAQKILCSESRDGAAAWMILHQKRAAVLLVKKPLCCHIVTRLNHVRKRTDTVRDQMNSICPSSCLYLFYLGWNNNMKGSSSPIHIYSTENLLLLLLQQTSKENLELYFLSVVNRPK